MFRCYTANSQGNNQAYARKVQKLAITVCFVSEDSWQVSTKFVQRDVHRKYMADVHRKYMADVHQKYTADVHRK